MHFFSKQLEKFENKKAKKILKVQNIGPFEKVRQIQFSKWLFLVNVKTASSSNSGLCFVFAVQLQQRSDR